VNRIDIVPDDVLLDIFDLYVYKSEWFPDKREAETWQTLVHVCRRWRSLVFQSPRRLNLQLCCASGTPAKDTLDVWPALPLLVVDYLTSSCSTDNVIAALGQINRVCKVKLTFAGGEMEKVFAAMQVPFPELTHLRLLSNDGSDIPIPDSFLGGSAPSLRSFSLFGIPFPGLPKLLSSATHLVQLLLFDIPYSGYISPESVIALISTLSSLETLCLRFEFPESRSHWQSRSLPTIKRPVLPALNDFFFEGVTEYLEELVNGIDTPQLEKMDITFFNEIDFDCTQLAQFIGRTPKLRTFNEARVQFDDSLTVVKLRSRTSQSGLKFAISYRESDRQLSSIEQICNSSLHLLCMVEDLYFERRYSNLVWKNKNTLWLQLLLPFTTVKNLYLSREFAPGIATTLRELVGGGITEVLPSLQNIFVAGLEESGQVPENIGQFVAARQFSDHPIAISVWDKGSDVETI
jgi:hypothetical protein